MKSGQYFYENSSLVKITSASNRSFNNSVQDSLHGFITQLQKGIFNSLQLLKFPTMYDSSEKMIFGIPVMISRENFEIRRVIYENGLVGNGSCLTIISAQDSVHGFLTSFQNGNISIPEFVGIFIDVEHYLENNI